MEPFDHGERGEGQENSAVSQVVIINSSNVGDCDYGENMHGLANGTVIHQSRPRVVIMEQELLSVESKVDGAEARLHCYPPFTWVCYVIRVIIA